MTYPVFLLPFFPAIMKFFPLLAISLLLILLSACKPETPLPMEDIPPQEDSLDPHPWLDWLGTYEGQMHIWQSRHVCQDCPSGNDICCEDVISTDTITVHFQVAFVEADSLIEIRVDSAGQEWYTTSFTTDHYDEREENPHAESYFAQILELAETPEGESCWKLEQVDETYYDKYCHLRTLCGFEEGEFLTYAFKGLSKNKVSGVTHFDIQYDFSGVRAE